MNQQFHILCSWSFNLLFINFIYRKLEFLMKRMMGQPRKLEALVVEVKEAFVSLIKHTGGVVLPYQS